MANRRIAGSYISGVKWDTAALTTALTGANNDLTYTAVTRGAGANDITVTYVDPAANDQSLSVDVTGTDITVNLATGSGGAVTSTATAVRDAVNADNEANDLVTAAYAAGNSGAGVVTALAETPLAGGKTETVGVGGPIRVTPARGLSNN